MSFARGLWTPGGRETKLTNWRQFLYVCPLFYNNKKPNLIFKRSKEMQESMADAMNIDNAYLKSQNTHA